MNATVYDIGAAARHREWKEREAALACRDAIEVHEICTREQIDALIGRGMCSAARRLQRRHGTRQAAGWLKAQGFGMLFAKLILLGRV